MLNENEIKQLNSRDFIEKIKEQAVSEIDDTKFANETSDIDKAGNFKTDKRSEECENFQDNERAILHGVAAYVNKLAITIVATEKDKKATRRLCLWFFLTLLIILIAYAGILIWVDTFCGINVRIEFLVSVIVAIVADIFAIVQIFVKYMTNTEHYEVFNSLIDSLMKWINKDTK